MVGIITLTDEKGKWRQERYPLIVWLGQRQDGAMQFATPYLSALAFRLLEEAAPRKSLKAHPNRAKIRFNPHHSYLVSSVAAKIKDPKAIEIVCRVCALIEQRGSYNFSDPNGDNSYAPHIGAETLKNDVEPLRIAYESASSANAKNKILARTFSRVQNILENYTLLRFYYPDIKLDIRIPTSKTLKQIVYNFPHSGKVHHTKEERDAAIAEITRQAKLQAMHAKKPAPASGTNED